MFNRINRKSRTRLLCASAFALSAAGAALVYACGVNFPLQLLDDRKGTLLGAPFNSFYYEAAHLVDPAGPQRSPGKPSRSGGQEGNQDDGQAQSGDTRNLMEAGLPEPQKLWLESLSTAPDGDAAYARGQGLPEPQRLYVAALVDLGRIGPPCGAQATVVPTGAASATGAISDVSGTRASAPHASASGKPAAPAANTANPPTLSATLASTASARAKPLACPTPESLRTRAAARLEAILELPVDPRAPRAMDAATALAEIAVQRVAACRRPDRPDNSDGSDGSGRANNRSGDRSSNGPAPACAPLIDAAHAAYARLRALAAQRVPDPLDLADKSYGDEALLELRATTGQWCDWRSFFRATRCADAIPAARLKRAIRLYAQQAASNAGADGTASLRYIAHWALADARRARALIDDDLAQRLLVAYALAMTGDVTESAQRYHEDQAGAEYEYTVYGPDRPDASRGYPGVAPNPRLVALVDAIRALRARADAHHDRRLAHVSGADRLASLAYRVGRYDLAEELVRDPQDAQTTPPSALAWWVRAKLALRRGDVQGAAHAYAEAARAFPQADASIEPARVVRIEGERGVLTLARGEYVQAFGLLYAASPRSNSRDDDQDSLNDTLAAGYENDVDYMAERVLTLDELKTFVDARVPATPPPPASSPTASNAPNATSDATSDTPADNLRYLLARRLVRAGRIAEALPYFPRDDDPRYAIYTQTPTGGRYENRPLRAWARAYGEALDAAQHGWGKTARAQAWFDAATLAKTHGMELMGYEQSPDFENTDGGYDDGSGRAPDNPWDCVSGNDCADSRAKHKPAPDTPAARAAAALRGPYVTAGEKTRYAASESRPYRRFHYRAIAADDIQRAADLLPPRSQAFAAVLCQATAWNVNDDPARARRFYRQYVKEGAYVNFGGRFFGAACAAPDFRAARFFGVTQRAQALARQVTGHLRSTKARVALAGMAGLAVLLIAAGARRAARRRKAKKNEAKRDEAKRDEAKQDEARQGEAKLDEAKQHETKPDEAQQHEARTD